LAAGLSGVIGISGLYDLGDLARLDPEIRNQAELFSKADPSRMNPNRLQAVDVQRTLMIHGAEDQKVPVKPVEVLIQRLKTEGAEITGKILPGVGHRLLDDPRSGAGVQVIDSIASWLMPKAEDDDVIVGEPKILRR
jgi:dipeptidyl aminopeptidase/acylaminoacyl peptidase